MTDLDALTALLPEEWQKQVEFERRMQDKGGSSVCDSCFILPEVYDALIEAARREAPLREALRVLERTANTLLVRQQFAGTEERADHLLELEIAANHARSLLHDNAGTATGDEVGEPERVP